MVEFVRSHRGIEFDKNLEKDLDGPDASLVQSSIVNFKEG